MIKGLLSEAAKEGMGMTKDVLVRLRGVQFGQDGTGAPLWQEDKADVRQTQMDPVSVDGSKERNDTDVIETVAIGTYYKKKLSSYILFEETVEGFSEPVKNKIKFAKGYLELVKSGPVNARMVFEEGVKNIADYHTPYGNILVGTDTKKIHMREEADRLTIHVDYVLEFNDEYVADCQICLDVCSHAQNAAIQ